MPSARSRWQRSAPILLAVAGAIALSLLAGVNLDSQGLYYDEVHQAPAAFHHLGQRPPFFCIALRGTPVLNMTYSGAVKSHVYGMYLRYVRHGFSVRSWRALGIGFVATGLLGLGLAAGRLLPLPAGAVLIGLIVTDVSVLLMSRHDWGPVALSLCLRLVLLSAWLSLALGRQTHWKRFAAAFVVGLAVFEKLSAVVLVPLLGLLLLNTGWRSRRAWLSTAAGLGTGALPLLVVNGLIFLRDGRWICLANLDDPKAPATLTGLVRYACDYAALGYGVQARQFVLGDPNGSLWQWVEATLVASLLLGVLIAWLGSRHPNRLLRTAGAMAACYLVVAVGLPLLPRDTFAYHWILGTPFQYAAIALALGSQLAAAPCSARSRAVARAALPAAVALLVAVRVPNVVGAERALARGEASDRFSPALTRLAEAAASASARALFIATDWGTAAQIYCIGNGQQDLIYEPFWGPCPTAELEEILRATGKGTVYTLQTGMRPQFREVSALILEWMARSPDWQEVAADSQFSRFSVARVLRFERRHQRPADAGEPPAR